MVLPGFLVKMTVVQALESVFGKERISYVANFTLADLISRPATDPSTSIDSLAEEDKKPGITGKLLSAAKSVGNISPYRFFVDALANNLFSLSYSLNEYFITGMNVSEVITTRIAAAVGNTLTGRPYGVYRDFIFKKIGVKKETHWFKKYLADVFVFATGQTPLYFLYMLPAGKDFDEMLRGAISLTLIAPAAGRPQGATYDFVRRQFGVDTGKIYNDGAEK